MEGNTLPTSWTSFRSPYHIAGAPSYAKECTILPTALLPAELEHEKRGMNGCVIAPASSSQQVIKNSQLPIIIAAHHAVGLAPKVPSMEERLHVAQADPVGRVPALLMPSALRACASALRLWYWLYRSTYLRGGNTQQ